MLLSQPSFWLDGKRRTVIILKKKKHLSRQSPLEFSLQKHVLLRKRDRGRDSHSSESIATCLSFISEPAISDQRQREPVIQRRHYVLLWVMIHQQPVAHCVFHICREQQVHPANARANPPTTPPPWHTSSPSPSPILNPHPPPLPTPSLVLRDVPGYKKDKALHRRYNWPRRRNSPQLSCKQATGTPQQMRPS